MKKILCTILSAIMAFSVLIFAVPTVASAAESQESVSETYGDFEYQIYDSSVTITKYTGSAESVTIPSKIAGYKVTVICEWAFSDCTKLKSVTIPNSVKSIGYNAFNDCANLSDIVIPDSVTEVEVGAFWTTKWFDNQPDGVVYAGKVAYQYKGDMSKNTRVVLKEGTQSISSGAFYGCSNLSSVVIPNSVSSIGERAFMECSNLKSVIVPKSVKNIGKYALGYYNSDDGNYDTDEDFIVKGYKGTAAEKYAKDNGFKFVALDKPAATAVKLNLSKTTLNVGQSVTLKATVSPAKAEQKCTWTTSNAKVATVDKSGKVVAKGAGTATITAKTANGKKAICKVTVNPAPTSVKLNVKTATMGVGQSATLKATVFPSKASQKCTWVTSNKKVATVTGGGKVVAKGVGTATITVKTANGKKATCKITVKKAPKSIKLSKTAITLKKGKTYTLKATLLSGSAGSKSWSTSNSKVATVSTKGVVTAKAKGTAYVTVKTYNGKTAKCKVVVK